MVCEKCQKKLSKVAGVGVCARVNRWRGNRRKATVKGQKNGGMLV